MTDIFDRAQELEEQERQRALAAQRRLCTPGPALSHCEECGREIPPERRKAVPACRKCIDCAEAEERAQKLKGKQ